MTRITPLTRRENKGERISMYNQYLKINQEVPQYKTKEQYEMYIESRKSDIYFIKGLIKIAKRRIKDGKTKTKN